VFHVDNIRFRIQALLFRNPDPGFKGLEKRKNIRWTNTTFLSKNCNKLFRLYEGLPSYRRVLQPFKRTSSISNMKFVPVFFSFFAIPNPDADFLPIPDPGVKKAPDPQKCNKLEEMTNCHVLYSCYWLDVFSGGPEGSPESAGTRSKYRCILTFLYQKM